MERFPDDFTRERFSKMVDAAPPQPTELALARERIYETCVARIGALNAIVRCDTLGEDDQETLERELMERFPKCVYAHILVLSEYIHADQWVLLENQTVLPSGAYEYCIMFREIKFGL